MPPGGHSKFLPTLRWGATGGQKVPISHGTLCAPGPVGSGCSPRAPGWTPTPSFPCMSSLPTHTNCSFLGCASVPPHILCSPRWLVSGQRPCSGPSPHTHLFLALVPALPQMTGRKGRVVSRSDGTVAFESRAEQGLSIDHVNLREKERFMKGEKVRGHGGRVPLCASAHGQGGKA